MIAAQRIEIQRVEQSRVGEFDFSNIPFGKHYTDHMFMADFRDGAWKNLRIVPYGKITISPASPTLHYAHSIFEGLKAYRSESGEALVFRPLANLNRLNRSAERMCLATVPEDLYMESMRELIALDREWIPRQPGASLYIRPFLFSADEYIGIRPSIDFTYMVILSPVGMYYSDPVRVKIETHYTRAAAGGTGYAKTGGNYAASIYPALLAQKEGYHQLLWTDGRAHEYIEESGTMNVMFVIDDTLVTPELTDSILPGITRDSVLTLARHWGWKVEERKVSVKEVVEALASGKMQEAFGVGTAATIAHIEAIGYEGKDYTLPPIAERTFANKLYEELEGIKRGTRPDPFNWMVRM
ncbi:MAG: branched-chain amino acid aminotransferase [Bacteroidota bacterium]|jgi:branched-chain amino acid aminotransferase|nr:MAG: branched chain amino acid aminotransferase [Bacteroidota bacterium]